MPIVVIVLLSQLLFTSSDLMGRHYMKESGFHLTTFLSWWFLAYICIRSVATVGQLYVFTSTEVGKTLALFGASSLILVNVLGVLLLGEVLSTQAYLGVALAIAAILLIAFSR